MLALAVSVCVLAFGGPNVNPTLSLQERKCKCEVVSFKLKPPSVSVENGNLVVKVGFEGELKSGPKSDETIDPVITIRWFLMVKKPGADWARIPLADAPKKAFGKPIQCGEGGKFSGEVSTGELGANAKEAGKEVQYELHLYATCSGCEMKPAFTWFKFGVKWNKAGDAGEPNRPTEMKYNLHENKVTKAKCWFSPNSRMGWNESGQVCEGR